MNESFEGGGFQNGQGEDESPEEFDSPETIPAEAAEQLEDGGELTAEEQERLVGLVAEGDDAQLACDVLMLCAERGRILTDEQKEALMLKVLSDPDTAEAHLENFRASGVEPTAEEAEFLERIEEMLEEQEDADEEVS